MPQSDPDSVAREALRLIGPDPENWVPDREGIDHNVFVVGGAQSGSAFAFALRRAGIGKVAVIDAAADSSGAGVWLTAARMHKLRTPKNLPGPELGLPGLGFQAWYEARHGSAAYEALDRIPRLDWAAYLDAVSEADRKIGLLLEQLAVDGLADDTIVFFFGGGWSGGSPSCATSRTSRWRPEASRSRRTSKDTPSWRNSSCRRGLRDARYRAGPDMMKDLPYTR